MAKTTTINVWPFRSQNIIIYARSQLLTQTNYVRFSLHELVTERKQFPPKLRIKRTCIWTIQRLKILQVSSKCVIRWERLPRVSRVINGAIRLDFFHLSLETWETPRRVFIWRMCIFRSTQKMYTPGKDKRLDGNCLGGGSKETQLE